MTAKRYLQQARNIQLKIKSMAEQLRSLRDAATNISPTISDMPRTASPNLQRMEDAIVRVVDLESAMCDEFNKLADIHKTINAVSDPFRHAVLVKRYINGDDWTTVAIELNISIRRVYQIHGDALTDITVLINDYSKLQ